MLFLHEMYILEYFAKFSDHDVQRFVNTLATTSCGFLSTDEMNKFRQLYGVLYGVKDLIAYDDNIKRSLEIYRKIEEGLEKLFPLVCPASGSFIGWKKALTHPYGDRCLVKLEIPEDALRSSAFSRKCRCSKANVLDICTLGLSEVKSLPLAWSYHYNDFCYLNGGTVWPSYAPFDTFRWDECSSGIHFFMTEEEAKSYIM